MIALIHFIQIVPGGESSISQSAQLLPWLFSTIATLGSIIVGMSIHIKKLNIIIKTETDKHAELVQRIYEKHFSEYKEVITANTAALLKTAMASDGVTLMTKETALAISKLRELIIKNLDLGKER